MRNLTIVLFLSGCAGLGCVGPLPLGAPCEAGECEGGLVCTPHGTGGVCAPEVPCEPRRTVMLEEPGYVVTHASVSLPSGFGVAWSASSNTSDQGELFFTRVDPSDGEFEQVRSVLERGSEDVTVLGAAYAPSRDRVLVALEIGDELVLQLLDGEGAPTGPPRSTGFVHDLFDNSDVLVVNGRFELWLSVRELVDGGFRAAGIYRMTVDDDGALGSQELLLGNAVFDGQSVVDDEGAVWFTYATGSVVEDRLHVGRLMGGEIDLDFASPATAGGVVGSQILPFRGGARLIWRQQGEARDQVCALEDCASTRAEAPFSADGYGRVRTPVVLEGARARVGGQDRQSLAAFTLVLEEDGRTADAFRNLGVTNAASRVSIATRGGALLTTHSHSFLQGNNSKRLELEITCGGTP